MRGFLWIAPALVAAAAAADSDRDFSGRWMLDQRASSLGTLAGRADPLLVISQSEATILCVADDREWTYALDGGESVAQSGEESRNSRVKWEGSALLLNTLVSGPRNYVIMDRWKLSPDRNVLTIGRQVQIGGTESEGRLVYRRDGTGVASAPTPALTRSRTAPPAPLQAPPSRYVVKSGTHILLALTNSVNTKHSHEGDRIYLETAVPIAVDGRMVIPRQSYVTGTVTESKRPGRVAGKGELYIRFDTLTLRNGTTRDFRSRLSNADPSAGKVDRDEGKITGNESGGRDARTVAETTGMGATIGGVAGAASGQAVKGLGVGAGAGAAVGLATVLLKRGPDLVLKKGTKVEMILDRDLEFEAKELP